MKNIEYFSQRMKGGELICQISLEKNRVMTDLFNITMNNKLMGNHFGTFQALSDGYTLFLKPLRLGNHKLSYAVSVVNPVDPVNDYSKNATYNLVAK